MYTFLCSSEIKEGPWQNLWKKLCWSEITLAETLYKNDYYISRKFYLSEQYWLWWHCVFNVCQSLYCNESLKYCFEWIIEININIYIERESLFVVWLSLELVDVHVVLLSSWTNYSFKSLEIDLPNVLSPFKWISILVLLKSDNIKFC